MRYLYFYKKERRIWRRINILSLYIFIVSSIFITPVYSQSVNNLIFNNISVKDGLSQGTVYCIYQDRQGFMWFGTGDGLNRYDGNELRIFKHLKGESNSISNNIINCITEDRNGNLWIGTTNGLNRYDPRTESFRQYKSSSENKNSLSNNYVKSLFADDSVLWIGTDMYLNSLNLKTDTFTQYTFDDKLLDSRIFDIHKDAFDEIWLATRTSGLIRFNPLTLTYKQYTYDSSDQTSVSSNHVYTIFEDSSNELWFGTWEHGVNYFDRENDRFKRVRMKNDGSGLNNNQIRCIAENKNGTLWIGTFEGLNIYNSQNGTFQYCLRHNNEPKSLSYNTINCMYKDQAGSTWLGTNGGGIDLYNPILEQFKLIDPKLLGNHDYGFIGPLIEHRGKIWIGTEGGGLACYDPYSNKYQYFNMYGPQKNILNSNTIKALCLDKNNFLWIGTYAAGIQTFDISKNKFSHNYNSFDGIDNNIVNEIFEDSHGNIWVGSNSTEGVHLKEDRSDRFVAGFEMEVDSKRVDFPWIRTICEPNTNEIWFGSIYYGIFIYKDGKTTRHISTNNSNLSSDYISAIIEDSNGRIWIGTYGGGVNIYNPSTDSIHSFTTENGLLNDNVCCIIEDHSSTIWISTVAGISKFDPINHTFTNYSFKNSGFPIETLNLKSGLLASDGQIYLGGNNGLVCFSPTNISRNKYIPPIKITKLLINNQPVDIKDKTQILSKSITRTTDITLKYNQVNITVEFAALNYLFPQNNRYMYFLEGYEDSWNGPGFKHQATYTNLPTGTYKLRIKACNNNEIWNENGICLSIHILPPPWKTWWAYSLYFLFFASIIYIIIFHFISKMKLENNIRLEQIEKQTQKQMHQSKLNMFTNFSHELRTPLTLILNPLKSILSETSLPAAHRNSLDIAYKNANRILTMVNQLLDLRKQESGNIQLRISESDIIKFTREIVIIFRELAHSKQINLVFSSQEDKIQTWFDPSLLEKVIYNILSNAIKNTPIEGKVCVIIKLLSSDNSIRSLYGRTNTLLANSDTYIELTIKDTGKGIPNKDIENIFVPFFQVNEQTMPGAYGTGLGLHITKMIVELHHGLIYAENNPKGGACFRIILPMNKLLFKENEFSNPSSNYQIAPTQISHSGQEKDCNQNSFYRKDTPIILIVDDNLDIRLFMKTQLQQNYRIFEGENGQKGWEIAQKIIPDLILTDIMMPIMDGMELCVKIKSNVKTSHIPVILLTARTSVLQIEEGLMTGADDYITKPFDSDLLKIRIKNIIENRKRLKEVYLKNFTVDIPQPVATQLDDLFLTRAYDYVKQNMSDPDLSIEAFGNQLSLSRTQLYRKIKALTGMSPSMFVSTLRLKFAAELLSKTTLSVSEIAYQVGFSNPSYFTTSFKKLYNITPTEYMNEYRKSKD